MSVVTIENGSIVPNNIILIDNRNFDQWIDRIVAEVSNAGLVGLDIETHDANRHEGFNRIMKVDDDGFKGGNTKLLFDTNRSVITGFSIYCDESDTAYYVNLAHADIENRLPWVQARKILDCKKSSSYWLCHNAVYEMTLLRKCLGYHLGNYVCTMQLAVSAWNEDTYSKDDLALPGLGEIPSLFPKVNRLFSTFTGNNPRDMDNEQAEVFNKVVAKESKAAHSWIGYMKTITWSFGLKKLSKKYLNYDQQTFEEVLGGNAHMGQLTGEQVAKYGADDAWVCVKLFHKILQYIAATNPNVLTTFFSTENPMIEVYSEAWGDGVRIDIEQVKARLLILRRQYARTLADLKAQVVKMLPFPDDIHEKLVKYDPKGYGKEGTAEKYRRQVTAWATSANADNAFAQGYQVKNPISKQWAEELGIVESKGMSINYYQVKRCILLDLCRCSFQLQQGKPASDADAIDTMEERWKKAEGDPTVLEIIRLYKQLAKHEQVSKLFINKYLNLTDPETGRVYPILNSLLNSRRMALAEPNLSQLPKYDGNAFVRSFFLADDDDSVVVSADWSGIELVLIGEESGDPTFAKVFGQIPHGDLHSETAAFLKNITVPELKKLEDYKDLRRDWGKVPNFGYWYSGALGQAAKLAGWSADVMWEKTDAYRQRFPVGEAWRVKTIQDARDTGIVHLPDGHTRIRFESTMEFQRIMQQKFNQYGPAVAKFGEMVIKKIQARSGNQAVNSKIQGTCATLAKRSILRIRAAVKEAGLRVRFLFPVHDELVFSVHKDDVTKFIPILRRCMCEHDDIVKKMKLDVAVAIGFNYLGWGKDNLVGQIELDECSKLPIFGEELWGKKLAPEQYPEVLKYLYDVRDKQRKGETV